MDDEVDVPERAQGDVGIDIESQPAALGEGGPEPGPADGFEEGLHLAVKLGRPGQVPEKGQAELFEDRPRRGAGTVAEAPIEQGQDALPFGLGEGLVPIGNGPGEAEDLRAPRAVRIGPADEDEKTGQLRIVHRLVPARGKADRPLGKEIR